MPSKIDLSRINPKQERFMRADCRFVAYGGARGGGKSWAVRKKATLLALYYAGIRILVLRRTFPELRENHINELLKELLGFSSYSEQKKAFEFYNGSVIKLGYCQHEGDVLQYQGQEYDIIFIDEATQFTKFQFETLTACLRGANDFPKRMYLTCNPGGVGHGWVKRLFIERRYEGAENPDDYEFIPATVEDNTVLKEKDPGYVKLLDNLSDGLRQAWRDGNWDMLAGQYFTELDRAVHVIAPVKLPPHWRVYRAVDYGLDCFACLWIAVDETGVSYVFKEYAAADRVVSVGCEEIRAAYDGYIVSTLAPGDLWARSQESGKSKAHLFAESGVPLVRSNNNREAGWLYIKELLKNERLFIFDNCTGLISCLTELQRDDRNPNDCKTEPHDITHLPDALRYYCAFWINPAKMKREKSELERAKERFFRKKL